MKRFWFRIGDKKLSFRIPEEEKIKLLKMLSENNKLNEFINLLIDENYEKGIKLLTDEISDIEHKLKKIQINPKEEQINPKEELFKSFIQNRTNYKSSENLVWLKARGKHLVESPKELLVEFNQKINGKN